MKLRRAVVVLASLALLAGCTCEQSETARNKATLNRLVEILNSHDYTELDTVVRQDYHRYCQATPDAVVESLDDFKALLQKWDTEIPDGQIEMHKMIAEGDLVAVWGTYSGTQTGQMGPYPATGKRASADFGGFFRLEDGLIVETWVTWDNMAMLAQLGLLAPPDAAVLEQEAE